MRAPTDTLAQVKEFGVRLLAKHGERWLWAGQYKVFLSLSSQGRLSLFAKPYAQLVARGARFAGSSSSERWRGPIHAGAWQAKNRVLSWTNGVNSPAGVILTSCTSAVISFSQLSPPLSIGLNRLVSLFAILRSVLSVPLFPSHSFILAPLFFLQVKITDLACDCRTLGHESAKFEGVSRAIHSLRRRKRARL